MKSNMHAVKCPGHRVWLGGFSQSESTHVTSTQTENQSIACTPEVLQLAYLQTPQTSLPDFELSKSRSCTIYFFVLACFAQNDF